MPADDYAQATRGTLKLKGVKDSKVDKKKKKKKKTEDSDSTLKSKDKKSIEVDELLESTSDARRKDNEIEEPEDTSPIPTGAGKTEAEKRHEEMRRKRVCGVLPSHASTNPTDVDTLA
jgi:protein FAM32A